jgi:hypothetical protein
MDGILTHVIRTRQLVSAATKRKDPNQSKVRNLVLIDPSFIYSLRNIGIPVAAITQNGMLSQKIHRQVTFSARAPPITGPMTDPIAH